MGKKVYQFIWTIYLVHDNHLQKMAGSWYTPPTSVSEIK